jgi:hypothetical protein
MIDVFAKNFYSLNKKFRNITAVRKNSWFEHPVYRGDRKLRFSLRMWQQLSFNCIEQTMNLTFNFPNENGKVILHLYLSLSTTQICT